jgi:hypothetical protein
VAGSGILPATGKLDGFPLDRLRDEVVIMR